MESTKLYTEEEYLNTMRSLYFPRYIWKFNQIVGYIEIIVTSLDVIFEIYMCHTKGRFVFKSKQKYYIEKIPTVGLHFPISNKSNDELKLEINRFLKMIENDFINKRRYIDYSTYENFIKYYDLRNFINNDL